MHGASVPTKRNIHTSRTFFALLVLHNKLLGAGWTWRIGGDGKDIWLFIYGDLGAHVNRLSWFTGIWSSRWVWHSVVGYLGWRGVSVGRLRSLCENWNISASITMYRVFVSMPHAGFRHPIIALLYLVLAPPTNTISMIISAPHKVIREGKEHLTLTQKFPTIFFTPSSASKSKYTKTINEETGRRDNRWWM